MIIVQFLNVPFGRLNQRRSVHRVEWSRQPRRQQYQDIRICQATFTRKRLQVKQRLSSCSICQDWNKEYQNVTRLVLRHYAPLKTSSRIHPKIRSGRFESSTFKNLPVWWLGESRKKLTKIKKNVSKQKVGRLVKRACLHPRMSGRRNVERLNIARSKSSLL